MNKLMIKWLIVCIAFSIHLDVLADGVVIVNQANGSSLSQADIQNIYLAKKKSFSDGTTITPVNLAEGNPVRAEFEQSVCDKSESQMKSYWAKLLFTGKAIPIKQLDSNQAVVDFVAGNKDAIGYVDKGAVNGNVKVVHEF